MKSMTGYGCGQAHNQQLELTVEIKTVNHRFFDCYLRMPQSLNSFDQQVRSLLKQRINRGKTEVYIRLVELKDSQMTDVTINEAAVAKYFQACTLIANQIGAELPNLVLPIAGLPGVIVSGEIEDEVLPLLLTATEAACDELNKLRELEGRAIAQDIADKVKQMTEIISKVEQLAPTVSLHWQQRLQERLPQLLGEEFHEYYPDQRLFAEVAVFAEKSCIDEEIVRFKDHLSKIQQMLTELRPVGKTMDFIAQELLREANTMGSKANSLQITNYVLTLKELIEQYREQVQNLL